MNHTVKDGIMYLSGETYKYKDAIKRAGGSWNQGYKRWKIRLNGRSTEKILQDIGYGPDEYEISSAWMKKKQPEWDKLVAETPFSSELCEKTLHHRTLFYRDGITWLSGPWSQVKTRLVCATVLAKRIEDGFANVIFGVSYD